VSDERRKQLEQLKPRNLERMVQAVFPKTAFPRVVPRLSREWWRLLAALTVFGIPWRLSNKSGHCGYLWIYIEADQGDVVMQTNWKWLGRDLCIAVILSAEKRGANLDCLKSQTSG
jgi:hypothetical protein